MSTPGLKEIYTKQINLADGGLGSTLEDILNMKISHTPLWSTRAAADDEKSQILIEAHLSFLRAGARILLTSTYQAAFNTFEREGYWRDEALKIMSNAVAIAAQARSLFCAENESVQPDDIRIALSLGTFGSTVSPMQDFGGIFPPPYGPKAYSDTEENTTSFGNDTEGREKSIQALEAFHAERLVAYTEMPTAWNLIDCIAFETLPVAREVTAIRRAVTAVAASLKEKGMRMKPWWITAVFPDGRCPETLFPGGDHISVNQVAALMVRDEEDGQGRPLATPGGIGINCTAVEYLPELLDLFKQACGQTIGEGIEWPWLVIKPNGGGGPEKGWADRMATCIGDALGQGWGGIIVGGCCKAGPDDIGCLASKLHSQMGQ
ncbi:Homocysteine S-methyltransferase [Melanogaster broomeanus]|nr:Homocysteine S-methyltransferase [Melanogaster broomeanus]